MRKRIIVASLLCVASFALSSIALAEETIVFGPETFSKGVVEQAFFLEDTVGMFALQVQNGVAASKTERVSGATIVVNGISIVTRKDVNKRVETFEIPVTFLSEGQNTLGVDLKGSPKVFVSIQIVKRPLPPNPTVFNPDDDLWALNTGEHIALWWLEPPADTDHLILRRSLSASGPWDEVEEIEILPYDPDEGYFEGQINPDNTLDLVDGKVDDLYYRLEALSNTNEVLKSYAPVHVPRFVSPNQSQSESAGDDGFLFPENELLKWEREEELVIQALQVPPPYNEPFLTDKEYESYATMDLVQIRSFLETQGSFLSGRIQDVDGEVIDPAKLIYDSAQDHKINPQLLLATMQKESSAVTATKRLPRPKLEKIMGYEVSAYFTIRGQITRAAWQFRKYFKDLERTGHTVAGWQVGVPKDSKDPLTVTPANKAVASLFTYTPWVGKGWGGKWGGNYLFWVIWNNWFKSGVPSIDVIYPSDQRKVVELRPAIKAKIYSPGHEADPNVPDIDLTSISVTLTDYEGQTILGALTFEPNEDAPAITLTFLPGVDLQIDSIDTPDINEGEYTVVVNAKDVNGAAAKPKGWTFFMVPGWFVEWWEAAEVKEYGDAEHIHGDLWDTWREDSYGIWLVGISGVGSTAIEQFEGSNALYREVTGEESWASVETTFKIGYPITENTIIDYKLVMTPGWHYVTVECTDGTSETWGMLSRIEGWWSVPFNPSLRVLAGRTAKSINYRLEKGDFYFHDDERVPYERSQIYLDDFTFRETGSLERSSSSSLHPDHLIVGVEGEFLEFRDAVTRKSIQLIEPTTSGQ